jgi:hypothetical protein
MKTLSSVAITALRNLIPVLLLSYASPVLAQAQLQFETVQLNQGAILGAHNAERKSVGVPPLTWSSDLQNLAQNWADSAAQRDPYPPYPPGHRQNLNGILAPDLPGYVGENIYLSDCLPKPCDASTGANGGASAVQSWAAEKVWYNNANDIGFASDFPPGAGCTAPQPNNSCGHYTQVVWKTTQMVGCGASTAVDGTFYMVCNYWPGGNIRGTKPYP